MSCILGDVYTQKKIMYIFDKCVHKSTNRFAFRAYSNVFEFVSHFLLYDVLVILGFMKILICM